jgi:hypothetical protein
LRARHTTAPAPLRDLLADRARIRAALERMRAEKPHRRLEEAGADGVPLRALVLDAPRAARVLARALKTGAYAPAPATVHRVRLDKERDLFRFRSTDVVVHSVLAELLAEAIEPTLSPCLYSYRAGRSSFAAVRALAAHARAHRRARPDPRTRGLHVLHCDVKSYGDSIPLGARSALWTDLHAVLGQDPLLAALVRPEIALDDGARATPLVGLATGSPIATVVANLYLAPLDRALDAVPGAFYARYGDDLVFVHPDASVVADAEARLGAILAARGLRTNPEKRVRCFWNGAGRPAPDHPGTTHVTFLGCRVGFDGTVGLPRAKLRALLADLRARVRRAARLAAELAPGARREVVCAALAGALDARAPAATPYASWLRSVVSDRRQLAELDHELARAVAAALTGRRGVRAFRDLPPRALRALGLPSLVALRNR